MEDQDKKGFVWTKSYTAIIVINILYILIFYFLMQNYN